MISNKFHDHLSNPKRIITAPDAGSPRESLSINSQAPVAQANEK